MMLTKAIILRMVLFKELKANELADLYRKVYSVYFYDPNKVKDLSLKFNKISAQSGFKVMEEMSKTSWLSRYKSISTATKLSIPTLILHGKQDIIPF